MFCRGTRGTQSPATACLSFAQPLRRGEREKTGSPPTENLICQTASGHLQAGLLYRPTHSGRRQPRKPLYFHRKSGRKKPDAQSIELLQPPAFARHGNHAFRPRHGTLRESGREIYAFRIREIQLTAIPKPSPYVPQSPAKGALLPYALFLWPQPLAALPRPRRTRCILRPDGAHRPLWYRPVSALR